MYPAAPLSTPALPRDRPAGLTRSWSVRLLTSAVLLGAGATLVASSQRIRGLEAQACGRLIGWITSTTTSADPDRAMFAWDLFTPKAHGLIVTPECTVAFLAGPLLLVVGVLAAFGRLRPWRLLVAGLVGAGLLVAVNIVRLLVIAWSIHRFGARDGFWWSHEVVGTILSLGGFVCALAFAIRFSFADPRDRRLRRVRSR